MAVSQLLLPAQCRQAILNHVRFVAPDEGCGLLAGTSAGVVDFVYPLTNADASPTSYTIDPYEHFQAWKHAEKRGWDLIGAFHSHPGGPPHPSPTDLRLAAEPDWTYVIAVGEHLRAFVIDAGTYREVAVIGGR